MYENRSKAHAKSIVPIAQIDWELRCISTELINQFEMELLTRRVSILEIGSQHGGTLLHWMRLFHEFGKGSFIVSVDTGPSTWKPPQDFNNSIWFDWAKEYSCRLMTIAGDSHQQEVALQVESQAYFDFVFVDGDHSYEGASVDFEMYFRMVRDGGIYAVHDIITPSFSPHIQVEKFWREVQAAGYVTKEIRAGASWGGIGVVYK